MKNNRFVITALSVILALTSVLVAGCNSSSEKKVQENGYAPDYLILVNKENLLPDGYADTIKMCESVDVDGCAFQVEETAWEAFGNLQDALMKKGVEIGVDSAYRSVEEQQEIMDDFIRLYGEEYAKKTVAVPGTSEHHTGLAIDIVPKVNGVWVVENEDMLKETEIFGVIHETVAEYGFILRYPDGKEAVTGYDYEPWHLRYVGETAAKEITERGITLEEYLEH